jgi:hypothetical protein
MLGDVAHFMLGRLAGLLKPSRNHLAAILLACCAFGAQGQAADSAAIADATLAEVALVPLAQVVEDRTGSLSADHLTGTASLPAGAGDNRIASFGFSDSVYWFSVALENPGTAPLQRLLVFEPTWLDAVGVTLIEPDGTRRDYAGGDLLAFGQRAVPHRQINFALTLPPGQSRLLVRVQTRDPFLVGMTLWERSAFFRADSRELLYFGLLYGGVGAMLLFNLLLFFSVRETVYAAYVAYLSAFLVMHANYNGHLYAWLWPTSPAWGNWAHSIFIYLFMIAGLFFSIRFLDLRARMPRAYRWALGLFFVILASFVGTAIAGGYGLHVSSAILWVVVYTPFVLLLGILSLMAGNRAARYFLPATVAGFIGSFVTASTVYGFIPFSFYSYRAVDFGMLLDAVLLSMALADRVRLARAEAETARAKLVETTRSYARQLEETVAQRTQELRQANDAKDKFFSIVAHDLRGPIGSLAVLVNEVVESAADIDDDILNLIRSTTKNTSNFLEELLTWSRSQRGEIDCHPVAIDMQRALRETQALFAAQAQAKGIRLDLEVATPCSVYADPAMTHTVLRNLSNNALKFTAAGGSVRAKIAQEGERCVVRIMDTGVGMSPELVNNLFRVDVKTRSSRGTANEPGTGLGLVLCKEFIEKNGGSIGVESEPGKGSSFWFSLPLAREAAVPDVAALRELARGLRVLVVEDDKLHKEAGAKTLQDVGISPQFAADGEEAVRLAGAGGFDLILMDIDLPLLDGIEAARRIRAAGGEQSRIVCLSSYTQSELGARAEAARFDGYLDKPLTRTALCRLLERLFITPAA